MQRPGGWRGSAALTLALVLVAAATVVLLDRFARHEFTVHLRGQAARALALAATAATPYEWRFRTADDLVAGQPFDARSFDFVDGGLSVQARDRPFEIGVPLPRPLDVRTFPHLHIVFDAGFDGELRISLREKLHAPVLTGAPIAFGRGTNDTLADLQGLAWAAEQKADAVGPPHTAAVLRLQFFPRTAGTLLLRSAALQRLPDYHPLDLRGTPRIIEAGEHGGNPLDVYRIPFAPQTQEAQLANLAAGRASTAPPLILLPERGRVEQQIALRNAVFAALPNAILIPEGQFDQTFAAARSLANAGLSAPRKSTQWQIVALFAAVLLVARIRSPRNPRWRALLEIVLTLAAPTWLILGGNYDGNLHTPQTVLIGLSLIYAVSLSLPRVWHWNGNAEAWLLSGLVVGLALAIGLSLQGSASHLAAAPGMRQILRYIGWALLQQYLICAVCTERWNVITGDALPAAYLGALCFALLHTPNAALMVATFIGGLCWCTIYLRHRALLPLAVSHASSALLLSSLLPTDILHSAEVSARFFQ